MHSCENECFEKERKWDYSLYGDMKFLGSLEHLQGSALDKAAPLTTQEAAEWDGLKAARKAVRINLDQSKIWRCPCPWLCS